MYFVESYSFEFTAASVNVGVIKVPVFIEDGPFSTLEEVEDYLLKLGPNSQQVRVIER